MPQCLSDCEPKEGWSDVHRRENQASSPSSGATAEAPSAWALASEGPLDRSEPLCWQLCGNGGAGLDQNEVSVTLWKLHSGSYSPSSVGTSLFPGPLPLTPTPYNSSLLFCFLPIHHYGLRMSRDHLLLGPSHGEWTGTERAGTDPQWLDSPLAVSSPWGSSTTNSDPLIRVPGPQYHLS